QEIERQREAGLSTGGFDHHIKLARACPNLIENHCLDAARIGDAQFFRMLADEQHGSARESERLRREQSEFPIADDCDARLLRHIRTLSDSPRGGKRLRSEE